MATYLILNIIFIVGVLILLRAKLHAPSKPLWITFCLLLLLTLVFDNVIVGLNIVSYSTDKILGIFVGYAPIEDFAYVILACGIVPFIWNNLTTRKKHHAK